MPQHERGDHLGPVRQVHLGGTLTASSRAATSGLAVLPASCVTTTTEPGASHGAELHHPGPRPGRRDRHPLATGQALLNPSAQLTDASDNTAWCLQDGRGPAGVPDRLGGQMLAIGAAIQSDRPV